MKENSKLEGYPFIDNNGYLWVDARVTRLGVMPYHNQPSDEYDNGQGVHQELKCEEELFKKETMDSFYGIPITIEHPYEGEVTPKTHRLLSVGTTMSYLKEDDDNYFRARLLITDPNTIEEIMRRNQEGENYEVSCGYYADIDWEGGEWNSIEYDAVQRNIRFNHLALVSEGRAGPEVRLII